MDADKRNKTDASASTKESTPWASIYMCGACSFIQAAQFSIYFSSIWPYLKSLDPEIPETMLGYMVALYSLAQFIAAPTFGFWSNKIEKVTIPLITGFSFMAIGNVLYLCVQFLPIFAVPYFMMMARFITGAGTGNATVLRTFSSSASTIKDRSRAIACVAGGIAVGNMFGPAFQLLFTPLSEEGISIGPLRLNIYTAPAVLALLMNIAGFILISNFFNEKHCIFDAPFDKKNGNQISIDSIAIGICVLTRFTQIFMQTTLETYGYVFNKQQTFTILLTPVLSIPKK